MKTKDIVQKEALDALRSHSRCGVGISMGVGKTLIGLMHMVENYHEKAKFLIAAPKKSIFKSWIDDAKKFNLEYLIEHIEFTTYLSIEKQSLNYDVLYLDECHSLLFTHELWLNAFSGKIVGLTGTPPKFINSEKGVMVNKYCPIVYKYITDSAVEDKILNDYRIVVHMLELDPNKTMRVEKKEKVWYTSEVASYEYWCNRIDNATTKKEEQICSVMRMKAIMDFPSKLNLAKELMEESPNKCIVFANTQEQADKLCQYSYHSKNPLSEDALSAFKSGKIRRLSCVLQLNEGVNIPELKEGIIMHAYGNERKSSQRIGRLLRLNPNDTAIVRILCYKNTVDERWVKTALSDFDQSKIIIV